MSRNSDLGHLLRLDGRRLYEVSQEVDIDQAGVLLRDLAVIEYDQRRDAADAVASGDRRLLVDIDFGETDARLEFLCGALEDRRHRAARTAPRRPEIDDHRHVVALDVLVEVRG